MKKPFEDRITEKIREVMEQYEPDYSPQAWEKLRKEMPVPVFWLKRVFLKYKYWFSGIAISGALLIAFKVTSELPAEKSSVIDAVSYEASNYLLSVNPEEKPYSEKIYSTSQTIPYPSISHEAKTLSSQGTTASVTDSFQSAYQENTHQGNQIEELSGKIVENPVIPVFIEVPDFSFPADFAGLIPIKSKAEGIAVLKSHSSEKAGKAEFQWPELNLVFTKEEGYDKFAGPNKIAFFYSPELLRSGSLKNLGISQGIGFSLEGPVRSSVSVSAGLSYQAINFRKVFSEKILLPDETTFIDSIGIRSGSYKYLEVPVLLNFKFFESGRSQIWLGTGISSIVFLKQDYTSETIVGGTSDQVSSSAKVWENILPLASINLDLLYRYKFTERLSLHSSVLYKFHVIPLGYNSMKLNRLTLQAGFIYRFGRQD
jgi:hypothetical protein